MSSFAAWAIPGGIPESGSGARTVTPESLFRGSSEKAAYQNLIEKAGTIPDSSRMKASKVKVRIFDLSDAKQVSEYEELAKELWLKASSGEVVVDSRKDLVHRKDGTSYWMKYVEYIEFSEQSDKDKSKEGNK